MSVPAERARASDPEFPPRLADIPESERVLQAFGWMPGLAALLFLGLAVGMLLSTPGPGANPTMQLGAAAVCVLLGAAFVWLEISRRRNRLALVPRRDRIGVYRGDTFERAIAHNQFTPYILDHSNTFKYFLFPVLLTGMFLYLSVAPMKRTVETQERLGYLAAGIYFAFSLGSLIRTRIACAHFHIPKGKGAQEILLTKADVQRMSAS